MSASVKNSVIRVLNTLGIGSSRSATSASKTDDEFLNGLDPHFRAPLLSMYRGESQLGIDGDRHPIHTTTKVSPSQGMWLYDFCLSVKPKATLEIGMAYGYSTLYFLAAMRRNQLGSHTAIDPFQRSDWHGIGLAHVQAVAASGAIESSSFRFIEDRSDRAAVDLVRSNSSFDVIFIDGNHRFDDVLVDFYLSAQICAIGGHIILDDVWMSSIKAVVAYLRENRTDFVEVSTDQPNICVFRKVNDDIREWSHFRKFSVPPSSD
jgi:predicted O-methyltransferase YrrM